MLEKSYLLYVRIYNLINLFSFIVCLLITMILLKFKLIIFLSIYLKFKQKKEILFLY